MYSLKIYITRIMMCETVNEYCCVNPSRRVPYTTHDLTYHWLLSSALGLVLLCHHILQRPLTHRVLNHMRLVVKLLSNVIETSKNGYLFALIAARYCVGRFHNTPYFPLHFLLRQFDLLCAPQARFPETQFETRVYGTVISHQTMIDSFILFFLSCATGICEHVTNNSYYGYEANLC
jgi:hypothetical protein